VGTRCVRAPAHHRQRGRRQCARGVRGAVQGRPCEICQDREGSPYSAAGLTILAKRVRDPQPALEDREQQNVPGGRPWIFKVSATSASAPNRSRTGPASAPTFWACSSSTAAARASRYGWTTASSASW